MPKKHDYIERLAYKLKRKYSKDELVQHLTKKQKELEFEIGVLKSEKDELHHKLERFKKVSNKVKSRFGQTILYQNIKKELEHLRKQNRKLKIENERLLTKIAQQQLKNK